MSMHFVDTREVGGPNNSSFLESSAGLYSAALADTNMYARRAESQLGTYRDRAKRAAEAANRALQSLARFRFANTNITLNPAPFKSANYSVPSIGPAPDFSGGPGAGRAAAVPAPGSFPAVGNISGDAPPAGIVTISSLPGAGSSLTLPAAPSSTFIRRTAPRINPSVNGPSVPTAPSISTAGLRLDAIKMPADLSAPVISFTGLEGALGSVMSGLKAASAPTVDLGALNNTLSTVESMVNGSNTGWLQPLAVQPHVDEAAASRRSAVASLWARRGLPPSDTAAYLNVMTDKEKRYAEASDKAFMGMATYRQTTDAIKLYVSTYSAFVDLTIARFDLAMRREMIRINASVLQMVIAAAEAEGYVLAAKIGAARSRAAGRVASAQAAAVKDQAEVSKSQVSANRAVARAYAAAQDAKGLHAQIYRAQVDAASTQVDAHVMAASANADMDVAEADAVAARVKTDVARYLGEIARIEGDLNTNAVEARAISARNRALASRVSVDGTIAGGDAAKFAAEAANFGARYAQIEADIQSRAGSYPSNELENTLKENQIRAQMLNYQAQTIHAGLMQEAEAAKLEGQEREYGAATRHFVTLSEAALRMAQLIQQINIQASEAEAGLKSAAGKAMAAVESGKLSGYRASVSYDADYRSTASRRSAFDVSVSTSANAAQSDTLTKEAASGL